MDEASCRVSCLTQHIFLTDFMPLLLLIHGLDSMFWGFLQPLPLAALEEESQRENLEETFLIPWLRNSHG